MVLASALFAVTAAFADDTRARTTPLCLALGVECAQDVAKERIARLTAVAQAKNRTLDFV